MMNHKTAAINQIFPQLDTQLYHLLNNGVFELDENTSDDSKYDAEGSYEEKFNTRFRRTIF